MKKILSSATLCALVCMMLPVAAHAWSYGGDYGSPSYYTIQDPSVYYSYYPNNYSVQMPYYTLAAAPSYGPSYSSGYSYGSSYGNSRYSSRYSYAGAIPTTPTYNYNAYAYAPRSYNYAPAVYVWAY
jgi:hypothetical protein